MIAVVRWPGITLTRYSGVRGYMYVRVVFAVWDAGFGQVQARLRFPWLTDFGLNLCTPVIKFVSIIIYSAIGGSLVTCTIFRGKCVHRHITSGMRGVGKSES